MFSSTMFGMTLLKGVVRKPFEGSAALQLIDLQTINNAGLNPLSLRGLGMRN